MKQAKLFHPRVFDEVWGEEYFKQNKSNICRVGVRLAGILQNCGFTGGKILDVGCGFASVPIEIAIAIPEAKVTGIDLSETMLDMGKVLVEKQRLEKQIVLQRGDAYRMDFESNSFDVVINSFLMHIVEDPISILNEIERVTKPGGLIIITDLKRGFLGYFVKKIRRAYALNEVSEIIEKSEIRNGNLVSGPLFWDYIANS